MRFEDLLALGRKGEHLVADLRRRQGWGVIPSYEFAGKGNDKAPRLMFEDRGVVIPDLDLACAEKGRFWNEVKTYWSPARFRIHGDVAVHGIKVRHYDDYLASEKETHCPVILTVLEVSTGVLLDARLASLARIACAHPACRQRGVGLPDCNWYFDRDGFRQTTPFLDGPLLQEWKRLRDAWQQVMPVAGLTI